MAIFLKMWLWTLTSGSQHRSTGKRAGNRHTDREAVPTTISWDRILQSALSKVFNGRVQIGGEYWDRFRYGGEAFQQSCLEQPWLKDLEKDDDLNLPIKSKAAEFLFANPTAQVPGLPGDFCRMPVNLMTDPEFIQPEVRESGNRFNVAVNRVGLELGTMSEQAVLESRFRSMQSDCFRVQGLE